MEIRLDLGKHCIETAVRRKYNQTLSELLKPGAKPENLEDRISLLKTALETLDFGRLRSSRPELTGGRAAEIAIEGTPDGRVHVLIDGVRVIS
jgi:hypothetical protein